MQEAGKETQMYFILSFHTFFKFFNMLFYYVFQFFIGGT